MLRLITADHLIPDNQLVPLPLAALISCLNFFGGAEGGLALSSPDPLTWLLSSVPSPQSYSQRLEPSHVPSPTAPRKQDSQQVHRSCPAGQLYTIPSTIFPPQDPSWWAADTHKHSSPWVCYMPTPHTGPSLHHRQPAAVSPPGAKLQTSFRARSGWTCGCFVRYFVEHLGAVSTPQRTPGLGDPDHGQLTITGTTSI